MANPTPEQQKFINNELKLMAQQDKQLGKAQMRDDQKTIAALGRDSQRYSQLAAKYNPVQAQDMTGLSNSARDRILANQARTNAVGSAQASGLAREIADQGKAATDFMRVMRSSNPARHREYVQYLHNIRPSLLEEKQASDLRNDLAEKEFGLSEDQFEWDKRVDKATLRASNESESNAEAAKRRVDRNKQIESVLSNNKAAPGQLYNSLVGIGLTPQDALKRVTRHIAAAAVNMKTPPPAKSIYESYRKAGVNHSAALSAARYYNPSDAWVMGMTNSGA